VLLFCQWPPPGVYCICKPMMMKHLLTAIACFLALSMSAQTPYNPDSDSDNVIGSVDLLDLLPLYGGEFYPSPSYMSSSVAIVTNNMTSEVADLYLIPILENEAVYGTPFYGTGDCQVVFISNDGEECGWVNGTRFKFIYPPATQYQNFTFQIESAPSHVYGPNEGDYCQRATIYYGHQHSNYDAVELENNYGDDVCCESYNSVTYMYFNGQFVREK